MMGGPPPWASNEKLKPKKPKSLKEVIPYLKELLGGFFYRLFYIFRLVWETKPYILFVMMFMSVWSGVMPVISAYIGAALLNSLAEAYTAGESLLPDVTKLLILQFAYLFANSLVSNINNIVSRVSGELVTNTVKMKIMNKAKDIDLASFDMPEFYEKLENANREAGHRPIQVLNSTFSIVSTLISVISFIVILAAISPFAPLIILVMSIPSAIISFIYRKKNFMYMRHRSKDRRQLNYYSGCMTDKDMAKEVRVFGLSDTFIGKYAATFKKYFSGLRRLFINEGIWNISLTLVTTAVNCLLFLYIAYKVTKGELRVGDYSLYTGALNSIANGVTLLIATVSSIYEGTLFIDNMIYFMREKKTIKSISAAPLHVNRHTAHTIELQNVSFRYPKTDRDVLKNINLTFDPGDTVVLVGLNGAGKTTLIKLLTRLYDPTEGRILLDGHDIREYDVDELYRMYGIIFQDFGKYAVDVKENIHFGQVDREMTRDEIEDAAQRSDADSFIRRLPDGYETPLMRYFEENGIELSIGQWQKLAIARAFYSDSDILILDEPTASLDAIAEQEIFNQFDSLRHDKTTVFVSHRLSSATVASKIVVLENGEVIEIGNHSELMEKQGTYYKLFSTQAQRYITADDNSKILN